MEFYLKSFQNILDSHTWLGEVVVMAMLTCPTEVSIQSQTMFSAVSTQEDSPTCDGGDLPGPLLQALRPGDTQTEAGS